MNFFEQQARARVRTRWLIFFFGLAVVATAVSVSLIFGLVIKLNDPSFVFALDRFELWFVGIGVMLTILMGSLWKLWSLSDGGAAIALLMGGRLVDRDTARSDQERMLLNIVEEMAIASGTPVPPAFVMDNESSINAFAAGFDLQDCVVAVTRGSLENLNRDELQGVIGHEFSHIVNGDMRINMRLLGILHGLVLLTLIGRILLRGGGRRSSGRKGGGQIALVGLGLVILGWFGYFFGRLIQASVSRQREFLADASSVQFTRNPNGLLNALVKIGKTASGSLIANENSDETRHFFFSNAFTESWMSLLSSHPPLEDRIKAIDHRIKISFTNFEAAPTSQPEPVVVQRFAPPRQFVGQVDQQGIEWSKEMLKGVDPQLRRILDDPVRVQPLVAAMLLTGADDIPKVLASLKEQVPESFLKEIEVCLPLVAPHQHQVLSLFLLALGTLTKFSKPQIQELERILGIIIRSGVKMGLFEFSLLKLIEWKRRRLSGQRPVAKFHSLKPLREDVVVLLKAASKLSVSPSEEAFYRGTQQMGFSNADATVSVDSSLKSVNKALERMQFASPAIKSRFVDACGATVLADQRVEPAEWDYLRAVSLVLDCPLPPSLKQLKLGDLRRSL